MKIELVDPHSLSVHPLCRTLPDPDPDLIISITCSVQDHGGFLQPLTVDEKNRVLDGRVRLKIALAEDLSAVPIVRANSADAVSIVIDSLLQRSHYSKSALAFLAFPFFESMVHEARQRQIRFLNHGAARSTQNVLREKTVEGIARQAGVSRALFFQARDVHALFKKHPHTRPLFEPKILSGDLCLGYVINGIAGHASTAGKSRGDVDQLELFTRGINTLRIRWTKWNAIPATKRTFVANEFAQAIAEAPEEIQGRVFKALQEARKAAR